MIDGSAGMHCTTQKTPRVPMVSREASQKVKGLHVMEWCMRNSARHTMTENSTCFFLAAGRVGLVGADAPVCLAQLTGDGVAREGGDLLDGRSGHSGHARARPRRHAGRSALLLQRSQHAFAQAPCMQVLSCSENAASSVFSSPSALHKPSRALRYACLHKDKPVPGSTQAPQPILHGVVFEGAAQGRPKVTIVVVR